ncbi:MAG: PKD domain-containing protein, partial [Methanobacteriota archaeon]
MEDGRPSLGNLHLRAFASLGMHAALRVALVTAFLLLSLPILVPREPAAAAGQITPYRTGLNVPIALAFASDGRIFFNERNTGSIRIIDAGGNLLPAPYITLPSTNTAGERGFLGLALDPGFPAVPYVYAYQTFTDAPNGTVYNRIVRIQGNANVASSYSVILRMPPLSGATNHNGGVIAFGPDGKLYVVVGENANMALSQNMMSILGKVLRLNSDGSAPNDNPFIGNATVDPRIFTYGHRNMFGLAFHPYTGRVFVTENGPNCNDEINLLTPGANYGWGVTETCATPPLPPANTNRDGPNPVMPIFWWGGTICPTNAAIYGGPFFPAFRGDMFMGDCNFSRLHRLHLVGPMYDTVASDDIIWTAPSFIMDVEAGLDGAIWFTTPTTIYRYWDNGRPPIASFTATPNPTNVGTPVAFDGSASSDPDGTIASYAWAYGDGNVGAGVTSSHAYAAP